MKKIHLLAGITLLGLLFLGLTEAGLAQQGHFQQRVLIGFNDGVGRQAAERHGNWVRNFGGEVHHSYRFLPLVSARLPENLIAKLKDRAEIAYAEDDIIMYAIQQQTPWGVDRIDADLVWPTNNTGIGVDVAILDTGIDYDHPDLVKNIAGGVNFAGWWWVDGSTYRYYWDDRNGHGSFCAGVVAAANNSIGVVGVAPGASLWAVKVLGDTGSGYVSDIIQGLEWCAENGIEVASMSFGGGYSKSLENACNTTYAAGVLLVAAAGNEYGGAVSYPAAYGSVIAVSATDNSDAIAGFSSVGPEVELAAPGVGIKSTYKNGGYALGDGTSMACPHVAGTAALVWAGTNADVRARLQQTAEDIGLTANQQGYGLVDAAKAAAVAPAGKPPVANDDSATTQQDIPVAINVLANDTDADSDPLTVTNLTQPSNGTAILNADQTVTYTPNLGFIGSDSFSYTANDGKVDSGVATVSITVEKFNNPPTANNDIAATQEDTEVTIDILANDTDADGDTLMVTNLTQPSHGAATLSTDQMVTYVPDADFNGHDSFTYTTNDGKVDSNPATVIVTVEPVNDPPVANDDSAATQQDVPVVIDVLANDTDVDGDILAVSAVTQGAYGSVDINLDNTVTYTPYTGFSGSDSFTYTASDGMGGTDTATVSISVNPAAPPSEEFSFTGSIGNRQEKRHAVTVAWPGAASMSVKLAWIGWADLVLRIYDPSGALVKQVDQNNWQNRVEQTTINNLAPGNWQVAAYANWSWYSVPYTLEGVVNY